MADEGTKPEGGTAVPPPKAPPVDISQMSDEEYNQLLTGNAPEDSQENASAPTATPVAGFWNRLLKGAGDLAGWNGIEGRAAAGQRQLKGAARGLIGLGNSVGNAVFNAATSFGGFVDRHTGLGEFMQPGFNAAFDEAGGGAALAEGKDATAISPETVNSLLGPKSDDPIANFTESTVQFLGGMALARGMGVKNVYAQGAIADAVAFDPYEAQLAELMAKAPQYSGVHELGELLSVKGDDGQIVARLKRAATGVMAGAVMDGLIAGARRIRFTKVLTDPAATTAQRAAAAEGIVEADRVIQEVSNGTHVSEGAHVTVAPSENGTWVLEVAEKSPVAKSLQEKVNAILAEAGSADPAIPKLKPTEEAKFIEGTNTDLLGDPTERSKGIEVTGSSQLPPVPKERRFEDTIEGWNALTSRLRSVRDRLNAKPVREFVSGDAPVSSTSRAEMETLAAEMNAGIDERLAAVKGVTPEQSAAHFEIARGILDSNTPEEIALRANGANFNLSYYTSQPEVLAQVEAISTQFREAMDAAQRRPAGIPVLESIRIAREAIGGMTERQAPDIITAKLKNVEDLHAWLLAGDMVMRDMGKKLSRMSAILDARPQDMIVHEEARAALEQFYSVMEALAGANSEVGRSLNILKTRELAAEAPVRFSKKGSKPAAAAPKETPAPTGNGKANGKPEPRFTAGMSHRDVAAQARMIRMADGKPRNIFAVVHAAEVVKHEGFMSKMFEVFSNFLLSGPRTVQTVGITGAGLNIFEPAVRIAAGATTGNRALMREGMDIMWGNFKYLGDNLQALVASARAGRSILNPQAQHVAIGGLTGETIRVPGRVIGAMDEFSRVTAYRAYVRAKSLRLGRQQGLAGPALEARVAEDLRSSFDTKTGVATLPEALKYAEVPTMSAPLESGSFGRGFQTFVNNNLEAKFIAPFVKSSANIINYVHKSIPILNLMNKDARAIMARGGEEAAVLHTRSALASMVYGYGLYQAVGGNLTGRGPSDPDLRRLWLKNHQPYSIKIDGKWISYARLDPLATPLGLISDVHTIASELGDQEKDPEDMAYAVVSSVFYNLSSKSYIQGITEFFGAWASNDPHAAMRWMQNMGGSMTVPQLVTSTNPDPVYRDVQSMADAIISRIPGWSKTLDPKFDIFGEPVLKTPGLMNRNQIFTAKDVARGVEDDLLELGKGLSPLTPKIEGGLINLKDKDKYAENAKQPSPYIRMMQLIRTPLYGELPLREAMIDLVRSTDWQDKSDGTSLMPGGERWMRASALKTKYEMRALSQVMDEYPKLRAQIVGVRRIKGAAITGGEQGVQDVEQLFGVTAK